MAGSNRNEAIRPANAGTSANHCNWRRSLQMPQAKTTRVAYTDNGAAKESSVGIIDEVSRRSLPEIVRPRASPATSNLQLVDDSIATADRLLQARGSERQRRGVRLTMDRDRPSASTESMFRCLDCQYRHWGSAQRK